MTKNYRPSFFDSLLKSCYDTDFYKNISRIPFLRSLVFLVLFSICVGLFALAIMWVFWSQLFPSQQTLISDFDIAVPTIEGQFDGQSLSVEPSDITLLLGYDNQGQFRLSNESLFFEALQLQLHDELSLEEALKEPPSTPGAYLYKDGYILHDSLRNRSSLYTGFGIDQVIEFNKDQLTTLISGFYPLAEEWLKRLFTFLTPALVFFYLIFSSLLLGMFFSFYGLVLFLLLRRKVRILYFLQLSFYCIVPSTLFALITAFLSISVTFMPFIVYSIFYLVGLHVYQE